ncbi:transglycosylase domain-containing protein [Bacillus sp. 1NLA3E]|uniref:transglycosylase domain-containing protein n=1 Tax=Bacillus sp. 1NLA3E TaxID=666686 RepID=UPI000247F102|nr:PBP1A family penicillin-binding protein [Bacillus sp. 1NLA3E]
MEIMTDHGFRKTIKYLRAFIIIGLSAFILMMILFFCVLGYAKFLGAPPLAVSQSTLYYADDLSVIGESNSGQKRYWLPLKDISPSFIDAMVSIEDKNFYAHHGFDYKRIAGAVLADVRAMAKVQGASTITQQYSRNLFLEHDKTWKRKLLEAFYTIRLEMNYSKAEILEGYLNTIYFGNGAYGVQAASQFYFGKDAADLNLAEASMLAGIPKGPGVYSPLVSMENAKSRQNLILTAMTTNHLIDKNKAAAAANKPISIVGAHQHTRTEVAPYFQDAVRHALKSELHLDERTIALGGLKIYTTLNKEQQATAEKTVRELISSESDIQVGMVAMDPSNGHVKAMIGGRNYEKSPFNRATQAIRQPGSTIKPILYYSALEHGFTPSTTMKSEPTTFRFDDNRPEYTPRNFNNVYANKDITMAQALALSDNIFAVKTHLFLGEEALGDTAKNFGITSPIAKVPSAALGSSGVRIIEMTDAYSHFANGGKKVEPVLIERVEDQNGHIIYQHEQPQDTVLKPKLTYVMSQMMTGMFDKKLNGYARVTGSTISNRMTRPYAGKSGSTETDSWMIGFTPQLVTTVWTGYDKGKPLELTAEKTYAKNIWIQFMESSLQDMPVKKFKKPKGVVGVYTDPENGKLATKDCPITRKTYFVTGTEPTEYCSDHIKEETKKSKNPKSKEKGSDSPWYKKVWGL